MVNMNVYQPMNIQLPDNPYTGDSFRQNVRDRMNSLKQAVLTSSVQPGAELGSQLGALASAGGSGDYSKYGSYGSYQNDLATAFARSGFDPSWGKVITEIVKRESSFNPKAKNPNSSAYGYGQFLTATRNNYEKKLGLSYDVPANQLIMMMHYVKDRYGTPDKALAFWNKNHWY